jgi:ABC-type transport system substrate-binding protein
MTVHTTHRARPGRLLIAVTAAAGLVAGACTSATENVDRTTAETTAEGELRLDYVLDQPSDPSAGGSVVYGIGDEGDGWNVSSSRWAGASYTVGKSVFDPLMEYDQNLELQPYLAQSVTSNEGFDVWTIALRPGVVFHDGAALDAEALKRHLDTVREAGLTGPALALIETVTVVDDLTVELTMNQSWSTFPVALTSQLGYVMAPSMLDDPDSSRNPVGTGPFVFGEWRIDESFTAAKNSSYWRDGLPYLDNIEFRVTNDVQTRSRDLLTGADDIIETSDALQLQQLAKEAGQGNIQLYTDTNSEQSEIFIAFNLRPDSDSPFRDGQPGDAGQIARDAVAWGIDREGLSQAAFSGVFPAAYGPHQESSVWYVDVPERPGFDLEKAKGLAAEYQQLTGQPLAFEANIIPTPEVQNIAQALQQQAREAGIEVTLQTLDQPKLIADALTGDFDATGFILFGAPTLERDSVFFADLPPGSALNFTGNSNPEIIAALEQLRSTLDPEVQKEAFGRIQQEMAKDNNFAFLVSQLTAIGFSTKVFGLADMSLPDGGTAQRSINPFLTETWVQR